MEFVCKAKTFLYNLFQIDVCIEYWNWPETLKKAAAANYNNKLQILYFWVTYNHVKVLSSYQADKKRVSERAAFWDQAWFPRPKFVKSTKQCNGDKASLIDWCRPYKRKQGLTELGLVSQNQIWPPRMMSGITEWCLALQNEVWPHKMSFGFTEWCHCHKMRPASQNEVLTRRMTFSRSEWGMAAKDQV